MPSNPRPSLDRNVSRGFKVPAALEERKPGMSWSDRIGFWFVSIAGLAIAASGLVVMATIRSGRLGGLILGMGFVIFVLGSPSQAKRNGYHD